MISKIICSKFMNIFFIKILILITKFNIILMIGKNFSLFFFFDEKFVKHTKNSSNYFYLSNISKLSKIYDFNLVYTFVKRINNKVWENCSKFNI